MGDDYKDYPFDRDNDAYEIITAIRDEKKSVGYRPQWVADILENRSVLACALDVHMTTTGSYERSTFDQREDVRVLLHVIEHWRESLCSTKEFDDAVKYLIVTTINEFSFAETVKMIG
jgi:hypothetical protein